MTIEKRFHQRINVEIDAHIIHRDRHITATANDITPYGMLLNTNKLSVPNGMLLEISMEVNGHVSTMPGLIIWANQEKIGVMFPQAQFALFTAAESHPSRSTVEIQDGDSSTQPTSMASKHILFQPEPHIPA
jgi:hypothetical protein